MHKLQNSSAIIAVFVLTGFMGYTLGPIVNRYLGLPNGGEIVMQAMAGTAVIFVSLSAYALTTRRNFSFMGGFLAAGILVAFGMDWRRSSSDPGAVADRLGRLRAADVGSHPLRDEQHRERRRDQLPAGDGDAVRCYLPTCSPVCCSCWVS